MLIARGLDGKPEIRLTLKIGLTEEKQNLRNRLDLDPRYITLLF
jgi:hypothetical protein